ncbi:rootletin-like [Ornithorhynchus anatinus]|uniref:rootletin-like n=1 Tax=Ornithorhynchus anatinus TaxID=9258 RepID=UPI0019D4B447|nr:rootletin-like [Ornithorhynchus anatinus]
MSSPSSDQGDGNPGLKLEAVIQRLEDTVLSPEASREDKSLTVRGEGGRAPPTSVPARIRQIVTGSLVEHPFQGLWEASSPANMQEENQLLQRELSRLEDMLAQTRAEKDELASKYHAVSERLEKALRLEVGQREGESSPAVWEMKRRFEEEEKKYKYKLQVYQEGQQRQAQLVQRLQSKVLQYKKRYGEMEQQLLENTSRCEHQKLMLQTRLEAAESRLRQSEHELSSDMENALTCLEEEEQRSTSFAQVNSLLREQLEHMNNSNQRLAGELEKMTTEVHRLRREVALKESRWQKEKETYSTYLSNEHGGILILWRQAAALRSHFAELQAEAESGLMDMRTEVARTARRIQTACLNLDSNQRLSENGAACSLEKRALQEARLEQQLRDKVREMIQFQSRWDREKVELNSRITELTALGEKLKEQNAQKEKTISSLKLDIQKLESNKTGGLLEVEDLKDESESLQRILHGITKLALADAESLEPSSLGSVGVALDEDSGRQPSPLHFGSSHRRRTSPSRAHSPLHHEAALQAVKRAFQKRRQREQVRNASSSLSFMRLTRAY